MNGICTIVMVLSKYFNKLLTINKFCQVEFSVDGGADVRGKASALDVIRLKTKNSQEKLRAKRRNSCENYDFSTNFCPKSLNSIFNIYLNRRKSCQNYVFINCFSKIVSKFIKNFNINFVQNRFEIYQNLHFSF